MKLLFVQLLIVAIIGACQTQNATTAQGAEETPKFTDVLLPSEIIPVQKTETEWKSLLSDMEYYVLREKGTERSFTGPFWDNKSDGTYVCGGCGLPLFDADTKFKSGTGWPSFYEPITKKVIKEDEDFHIGYRRVEVLCARCDGHLGHVFADGPEPSGLRYCINGASLDFVVEDKAQATHPD